MAPISGQIKPRGACFFGRAKTEDRKLRKELALEVPYLEGTLQELALAMFLNPSLVAEANFLGNLLMAADSKGLKKSKLSKPLPDQLLPCFSCRTRTRVAEKRPASHTLALDSSFIARNSQKRKRQSKFPHESLRRLYAALGIIASIDSASA
jgi:hypothetical protein